MDGRGIAAALALGASAVQLGTAFLTCDEAGVPEAYKQAILGRAEERYADHARVLRPPGARHRQPLHDEIDARWRRPAVPAAEHADAPAAHRGGKAGRAEFLSLWAGQGVRLARRQAAADLVAALVKETDDAITRLPRVREGRL